MGRLIVFLFVLGVGFVLSAEITKKEDIEFAKVEERSLKLDLYFNGEAEKPTPLIVWIHGGAWRAGSRKGMPIQAMLARGYTIASVDYRLTPVAPFPANVHDIKAAIRFLKANAARFGVDPQRVIIAGASAGGHLASLVGLSNGVAELEGKVGRNLDQSSEVNGVVSFYGASDLSTILSQSTQHGLSVRVPALKLLLGGSPEQKAELAWLASPLAHLDSQDPPVLLVHGNADNQMPYAQSTDLKKSCDIAKIRCELITVDGGGHGGKDFYTSAILDKVTPFLKKP
ncbi:alpha/beta hydrolase [Akkermansiaceae bacterium]|nr:alpha/beta hydrolase [Akkermansiaceae bacterium]MDA7888256.1 alpha/beta hydrolase [Akkermansiaceae bacterium]